MVTSLTDEIITNKKNLTIIIWWCSRRWVFGFIATTAVLEFWQKIIHDIKNRGKYLWPVTGVAGVTLVDTPGVVTTAVLFAVVVVVIPGLVTTVVLFTVLFVGVVVAVVVVVVVGVSELSGSKVVVRPTAGVWSTGGVVPTKTRHAKLRSRSQLWMFSYLYKTC